MTIWGGGGSFMAGLKSMLRSLWKRMTDLFQDPEDLPLDRRDATDDRDPDLGVNVLPFPGRERY